MEFEKKHSTLGDYIILKTLGTGCYSKVKLAYNKNDGNYYAIKILKPGCSTAQENTLRNEFNVLKSLSHPHIINLLEFYETAQYKKWNGTSKSVIFLVLELATGGELFEYLFHTGRVEEETARAFFHQIISALEYMHAQGITHRDLKPENILLDDNFSIKVGDFGFSTFIDRKLSTVIGTELYMAPEIHLKMTYNGPTIDLFAAAIILFIMYAGTPPFSRADPRDDFYKFLCTNKHEGFWKAHLKHKPNSQFFSENFKNLMNSMLAFDPTQRLSLSEIKAHPWFNGTVTSNEEIFKMFYQRKQRVDIETEIQKKRKTLKKKIQEENYSNLLYTGMTGFRDLDAKTESPEFNELNELMPDLKQSREIKMHSKICKKLTTCIIVSNEDYLLRYLLKICLKQFNEVKLKEKSYKIFCKHIDENSETLELYITIFKLDDEANAVEFRKKQGSLATFYSKINAIREILEKLNQEEKSENSEKNQIPEKF